MSATITTEVRDEILYLNGVLDCHTLNSVWQQKQQLLDKIKAIDVSKVTRVDSSGLALLTYCCIQQNAKLIATNPQLQTLIELYDLDAIVV